MSARAVWAPLIGAKNDQAIEKRLRPFRDQRVLDALDIHVVDQLGELMGERDPDVLLALALVVRAPRFGHICVDITRLKVEDFFVDRPEQPDGDERPVEPLELPKHRSHWLARVAKSPMVGTGDPKRPPCPFVIDGDLLYADRYFSYQTRLAGQLLARVEPRPHELDERLLRQGLNALFPPSPKGAKGVDRQKIGAAMALLRGFAVISGGPGTGKTYTVRNVLTLLWADWARTHDPSTESPGPRVALAAPTGKAAARMKESILDRLDEFLGWAAGALPPGRTPDDLRSFLDGLAPSTIHRLLGWDPANPTRFRHNAEETLPHDAVVVDEASMVDFAMMAKLVDAVAPEARLILLGDQHQLASVEAGTVLADVCGPTSMSQLSVSQAFAGELENVAGIGGVTRVAKLKKSPGPHDAIVQLDKNVRFTPESGIGHFAQSCLADKFDADASVAILAGGAFGDVALIGHGKDGALPKSIADEIVGGYLPYLRRLVRGPVGGETLDDLHTDVLDLFNDYRVLCAHRQGRLGVAGMNATIASLLERALESDSAGTARGRRLHGTLSAGSPILVTTNDYVVGLFNGDVGIVVEDEQEELKVAFPAPKDVRQLAAARLGKNAAGADQKGVRYVAASRLPEHETVFAMTIHKSQGSEFDRAVVILPDRDSPILTRELVYTGVTRAKQRMTMVATAAILRSALTKTVLRASGLRAKLWGDGGGAV